MREVLTFILAGGRGERLDPLTRDRTKPAVPFGGIYRIIDFTLSNCINSGLRRIYVLTQYKSFSLQKHLLAGWDVCSNQLGEFIDIIPAQQRVSTDWYKGTADAIYQNTYVIQDCDPELILILYSPKPNTISLSRDIAKPATARETSEKRPAPITSKSRIRAP